MGFSRRDFFRRLASRKTVRKLGRALQRSDRIPISPKGSQNSMQEAILALQNMPSRRTRTLALTARRTGTEDSDEPDRPATGEAEQTEG